jgi:hypothetical protein
VQHDVESGEQRDVESGEQRDVESGEQRDFFVRWISKHVKQQKEEKGKN